MQKIIRSLVVIGVVTTLAVKVTLGAFTAQGQVKNLTLSVGHADLALLKNLAQPPTSANLTSTIAGHNFTNLKSHWQATLPIKLFNQGSLPLSVPFTAQQLTMPPADQGLANVLKVQVFEWQDSNNDGLVTSNELGASFENLKTLQAWVSDPFELGVINPGQLKGLAIQFQVGELSNSLQGASAAFDLTFAGSDVY